MYEILHHDATCALNLCENIESLTRIDLLHVLSIGHEKWMFLGVIIEDSTLKLHYFDKSKYKFLLSWVATSPGYVKLQLGSLIEKNP